MKVAIVRSGILGLSAAHALLDAKCDVTVFDAYEIPNPASASYDRSRMMRLQYGPQSGYARLAHRALKSWVELEQALETRLYRPTGVCIRSATAESWTAATSVALADVGIEYQAASLDTYTERVLNRSALGHSVYTREGGVLLADQALIALTVVAARKGAWLRLRTPVIDVDTERGLASPRPMQWLWLLGPGHRNSSFALSTG
jgi:glycine/D-amino acid oxidase-like deaminating enzyme